MKDGEKYLGFFSSLGLGSLGAFNLAFEISNSRLHIDSTMMRTPGEPDTAAMNCELVPVTVPRSKGCLRLICFLVALGAGLGLKFESSCQRFHLEATI